MKQQSVIRFINTVQNNLVYFILFLSSFLFYYNTVSMSLDRVLLNQKPVKNQNAPSFAISKYQRPAIASTRAWIFDTEKLLNDIKFAENSSQEMRAITSQVLSKDNKEAKIRASRVDREVKGSVEKTAQMSNNLDHAIHLHEAELVKLLQERTAAREALALVYAPLEKVRKRIELRIANPLPLEERTDTSVMESLQIVSKSLAEASRTLIAFIKDAERHCTHMESLRQAMRLEINDKFDSMKVTYASSHECSSLPPIHAPSPRGVDTLSRTEYAQMLKSDMLRCLRLSQASIAESGLLRAKLSQCIKDITLVRKRNEKLLNVTLEAHVKDTEMLQRTLAERRAAVQAEIEKIRASETEAHAEYERLKVPCEIAVSKMKDHHRYSRVLRDGRMTDPVIRATHEEAEALKSALKDASHCEKNLGDHRQRLEGYVTQLSQAEKSKAKVMQLALSTKAGELLDDSKVGELLSSRHSAYLQQQLQKSGNGSSSKKNTNQALVSSSFANYQSGNNNNNNSSSKTNKKNSSSRGGSSKTPRR